MQVLFLPHPLKSWGGQLPSLPWFGAGGDQGPAPALTPLTVTRSLQVLCLCLLCCPEPQDPILRVELDVLSAGRCSHLAGVETEALDG